MKLNPNVPLSEVMCRTYDLAMQTQGHTSRSSDLSLVNQLVVAPSISPEPFKRFSLKLHSDVPHVVQSTRPSYLDSKSQVKVLEFCVCSIHVSPEPFG